MSHTVTLTSEFKASEKSSLVKAFEELNWTMATNRAVRAYEPSEKRHAWVALNPNTGAFAYDLILREDTAADRISIEGDYYGGGVEQTLGKQLGTLKQCYAKHIVRDQYALEFPGAEIQEYVEDDGSIALNVTLWGDN